jgi:glycerophosphoryl diester phosphodiesterase
MKNGVRICAHRGLSHACPENTLPAFGAALALGVDEVEYDLWLSADGVAVVCHDPRVDRTTDGDGIVMEMAWPEIQVLDAGVKTGDLWSGVRVTRFERVLDTVSDRAGHNIHIKDPGPDGRLVKLVCDEIQSRGLVDLAYIAGMGDVLAVARDYAPDVTRCCLAGRQSPDEQIDLALKYDCARLQFNRKVTVEGATRAHDKGLINNLFWSDEVEDARAYVAMGIDVVLTNEANKLEGLKATTNEHE